MNWTYVWIGLLMMVWLEIFILSLYAFKKKFIPASDIESAIEVAKIIQEQGLMPVLSLLGEHYTSRKKVDKAVNKHRHLIGRLYDEKIKAKISVKPTQVGLAISREEYKFNILQIAKMAHREKVPLEIDVESLRYLDDTLGVFLEIPGEFLVRQAVQAYLRRSKEDVGKLIGGYKKVRLVKGAYAEGDLNESETQAQMKNLAEQLLLCGNEPAVATIENEELIDGIFEFADQRGIPKDRFIIQTLYGVGDDLKRKWQDKGLRMEVYVPVGPGRKALPYLRRRVKELEKNLF